MEGILKARKSVRRARTVKKYLFLASIIGVQLALFCFFYVGISGGAVLMAFQKNTGGRAVLTLDHFKRFFDVFLHTSDIWIALRNTFIFFFFGFVMLPISFANSYFMYKKIWGYKIFRVLFFLPSVISMVVWSQIYGGIVGPQGPVARLFQILSGSEFPPHFLGDSRYALIFVILYSFWLGYAGSFILFGGALSRIPESVIEAGKIDGVGWFRELVQVIIPLVWPTLSTMLILSLTGLFTASGNIFLLTNGAFGTTTISFIIFQNTYNGGNMADLPPATQGYTAALGLVFTVLTIPLVFLTVKLLKKVEDVKY
ncbi:MAG: sugar ABC transporter permease [Clostridiales bacterium]|jgi:ABC-type sugar transport system permease subunit|nr:sugar ABC transporter permease [Clostridiales bacterium]